MPGTDDLSKNKTHAALCGPGTHSDEEETVGSKPDKQASGTGMGETWLLLEGKGKLRAGDRRELGMARQMGLSTETLLALGS